MFCPASLLKRSAVGTTTKQLLSRSWLLHLTPNTLPRASRSLHHCALRQLAWPSMQQHFSSRWYSQNTDRADEQKKDPTMSEDQTFDDLFNGDGKPVHVQRQIIWTVAFTVGIFCLSANLLATRYYQGLEQMESIVKNMEADTYVDSTGAHIQQLMDSSAVQALVGAELKVGKLGQAKTIRYITHLPEWISPAAKRGAVALISGLYRLSFSERCVYSIIAINVLVFGLWQIPCLLPSMTRHFLHQPHSGKSYTLLTSMFSHVTPVHLISNMVSFWAAAILISEVVTEEQFIAMYLSAGVISSLAMHIHAAFRPAFEIVFLGASGTVYGLVGIVSMFSARKGKASESFPLTSATMPILFVASMAGDCIRIVFKWRRVGYVVHLTGGILGVAYAEWYTGYWSKLVLYYMNRRAKKDVAK